jgi:hypothetical protein
MQAVQSFVYDQATLTKVTMAKKKMASELETGIKSQLIDTERQKFDFCFECSYIVLAGYFII